MTVIFDKINDYRNFFFDYHYIHVQPTNSLATSRRQRFVYSLHAYESYRYDLVAEPLFLHCGTEQGFQSSSSGKRSLVSCAGYRVYQKKLADRNVCLV